MPPLSALIPQSVYTMWSKKGAQKNTANIALKTFDILILHHFMEILHDCAGFDRITVKNEPVFIIQVKVQNDKHFLCIMQK